MSSASMPYFEKYPPSFAIQAATWAPERAAYPSLMDSAEPFALKPKRTAVRATTRRLREKGPPRLQRENRSPGKVCERKKESILQSSFVTLLYVTWPF